jgi:ATP-binding cassette subfamily C protein
LQDDDPPDNLPSEVLTILESVIDKDESVSRYLLSDINEKGDFGDRWLITTSKRILTINVETKHNLDVPLELIKSAESRDYVGNGEIILKTPIGEKRLIRFSRKHAKDFRKFASYLDAVVKKEVGLSSNQKENGHYWIRNKEFKKRKVFRWLLTYLRPSWLLLTLSMIFSLVTVGLSLIPARLMGTLVDEVFPSSSNPIGDPNLLLYIVLGLLGAHITSSLLNTARSYTLSYLGQKITYNLRVSLYNHLQRMSLSFYDKFSSGRIMQRLINDTQTVQWLLSTGFQSLIISLLQIAGIGFMVFTINPRLALISLLPVPIIVLGWPLFRKKARKLYHRNWRRHADVNSLLWSTIPGTVVVKTFVKERFESKRFIGKMQALLRANLDSSKLNLKFFPAISYVTYMSTILIWWYGGNDVFSGALTTGALITFISYISMFYSPIQGISNQFPQIQSSMTSAERIFEVLEMQSDVKEPPHAIAFDFNGKIDFENVSFGYDPYIPILKNINLSIKPGEVVGIVGSSGSGKTTFTKLLMRFYDPNKGTIRIDNTDLKNIKLKSSRSQVGIVLQEPNLFYGSLAYNIAYSKETWNPEEIIASAKAANVHEFAMDSSRPLKYDTNIGTGGKRLSGGERQRVAIARAILSNPKILILDEATSSVDNITERKIQNAMNNLIKDRTTIIIAHRLSTLRNADRIIVMEKGIIMEIGNHVELMNRKGLYSKLYNAQFEKNNNSESDIDGLLAK